MKILITLCLLLLVFISCKSDSDEKKAQQILADVYSSQNKQKLLTEKALTYPNIFGEENLKKFPENRLQLESVANDQINLLKQIIEISEEQIGKLRQIENLQLDGNFLEYSKLSRQIFEKRLEDTQISVQKFQLILDENLTTRQQLDEDISAIEKRRAEIDSETNELENQKQNVRKSAGK